MASRKAAEPMFELRKSGIQGRGAFATRRIRKGTRIIEYIGERISSEEGDERYDDSAMGRHHTFLFSLDDGTVVDAAVGGNDARFINHSCDPNCEAVIEKGHIYIDALRTIQPGEELGYDYAYERSDDHTEDDEKLYKCKCGSDNCRGTILAPPKRKRTKPAASKRKRTKLAASKRTRVTKKRIADARAGASGTRGSAGKGGSARKRDQATKRGAGSKRGTGTGSSPR